MLGSSKAFSGFAVDDIPRAKRFYGETLGVKVSDGEMGMLTLHLAEGTDVMVYPKGDAHEPASFTILNFPVDDIEAAVDGLAERGVTFERVTRARRSRPTRRASTAARDRRSRGSRTRPATCSR